MPQATQAKKLVSVSATCALVIGDNKEVQEVILDRVFCIYYPVQFRKDKEVIRALINSGSKVNTITPAYASNLGLRVQKTVAKLKKSTAHRSGLLGRSLPAFR